MTSNPPIWVLGREGAHVTQLCSYMVARMPLLSVCRAVSVRLRCLLEVKTVRRLGRCVDVAFGPQSICMQKVVV